jgi:hypothetical protein
MRALFCFVLLLIACKKQKPAEEVVAVAVAAAADAVKEQAFRDLQNDVLLLRAQLQAVTGVVAALPQGRANTALYTCDRVAIAGRQLADDARAQSLIGEADALCAYKAPLAAALERVAAIEAARAAGQNLKTAPPECTQLRDALNRVGAKYKNDPQVVALVTRFKSECPRMRSERSAAASSSSAPAGPDPRAQRDACKKRCDDAAFECRSRCQYCGTCTSDKTWEWCNATCNSCRQGCEQNERFCQSSCGS